MKKTAKKKKKKKKIPCRTDEQLREVALGIVKGAFFTNLFHMDPRASGDLLMVFLPIALGALDDVDVNDIGLIYARIGDSLPRSINGMPIFHSCSFLNREDTNVVVDLVKEMNKSLNAIGAKA
jgi:hypothetical protein